MNSIHLIDPSAPVIDQLQNKIKDTYIPKAEKIFISQKKGQEITLDKSSKIVFIAGMGGKETIEIINHLIPQFTIHDRLVVSPHKNLLEVRQFLNQSALKLEEELCIHEEGQYYQVLCLSLRAKEPVTLFGSRIWQTEVGQSYRKHLLFYFDRHRDKLSRDFIDFLNNIPSSS